MAGVGLVLDQHLPIAVVHVAQHAAGDLQPAGRRAVDHVVDARQALAEELLEARAGVVQLGEDEAAVVVDVANRVHALRGVAVFELGALVALASSGICRSVPSVRKRPGVIRAAEELAGVAAGLGGDARALVRAAVVQDAARCRRCGAPSGSARCRWWCRNSRPRWAPGCRGRHRPRCWRTGAPSRAGTPPRRYRRRDEPRSRGSGCGRPRRCRGIGSSAISSPPPARVSLDMKAFCRATRAPAQRALTMLATASNPRPCQPPLRALMLKHSGGARPD